MTFHDKHTQSELTFETQLSDLKLFRARYKHLISFDYI